MHQTASTFPQWSTRSQTICWKEDFFFTQYCFQIMYQKMQICLHFFTETSGFTSTQNVTQTSICPVRQFFVIFIIIIVFIFLHGLLTGMLPSCFRKVSIWDGRALLSLSEQSVIHWCFDCLVTFVWVSFGYNWLRFSEPWCVVHSSLRNPQPVVLNWCYK